MFRRGFIDALGFVCSYDTRLDRFLAAAPRALSLANHLVDQDDDDFARLVANPRSTGLAALHITSDRMIQHVVDRGVVLRALSLANCSRASARLIADSGLLANVERLVLGAVEDGAQVVSAAPRLRAPVIDGALDEYAAAIPQTVVGLGCHVSSGIDEVAALSIAPTRPFADPPTDPCRARQSTCRGSGRIPLHRQGGMSSAARSSKSRASTRHRLARTQPQCRPCSW